MGKWIITTNPTEDTAETIQVIDGDASAQDAAAAITAKTEEIGASLYLWQLVGHSEADVSVTLVQD